MMWIVAYFSFDAKIQPFRHYEGLNALYIKPTSLIEEKRCIIISGLLVELGKMPGMNDIKATLNPQPIMENIYMNIHINSNFQLLKFGSQMKEINHRPRPVSIT